MKNVIEKMALGTFAATAILIWTGADAVTLNPRGLGQVLVYPYYTVNKGQDTLISVVNTSGLGEVVGVTFSEGVNGRRVLDFALYLSAQDVWTARIGTLADTGGAAIFSSDRSCTRPVIPADGLPFIASGYAGGSLFPSDGGPTGITRTREGFVTLIALGDIISASPLEDTITHVQKGTPEGGAPICDPNLLGNNAAGYVVAPSNNLSGSGSIVNVSDGTFFAYNANAVAGFSSVPLLGGTADIHATDLVRANTSDSIAGGAVAHLFTNGGEPLNVDYVNGIDAVSAVFMQDVIYNEYLTSAGLGANTDWVVTFPTKIAYVDAAASNLMSAIPPFKELFHAPGISEVGVVATIYDREEGTAMAANGTSLAQALALPYAVNVVSLIADRPVGDPSGVLGSTLSGALTPYGDSGRIRLDLASADDGHAMRPDCTGHVLHGLPATGFMVYNIINVNAQPGKLANYGGLFPHSGTIQSQCVGDATHPCE